MRRHFLFSITTFFALFNLFAGEKPPVPKWAMKSPFEQKVFIENLGQYSIKEKSLDAKDIVFGTRQDGLRYFFTKDGLWIMNYKPVKRTEREIEEEMERCKVKETKEEGLEEKEWMWKFVPEFHHMQFIGANPNVEIVGENEQKAVHNFYVDKRSVAAHAWKKLVYKELYPGIDMELYFPEDKNGGFKYNLIVKPGADPSVIKIKYPGNDGIQLSAEGNIIIESPFGKFTDHAPIANEAQTAKAVDCSFNLNKNTVQFNLANYDASKGLIIDPFTSTPVFAGGNSAYDVDWDNGGNCYVYGGTAPFQVLKYDPAGTLLWTYTTAFSAAWYYGDFAVDHNTGASYIVDGFNGSGAQAIKINTTGAQVVLFNGNSLFQEMWRISFSKCTNQAVIAGGGTTNPSYTGCYLDTTLSAMNPVNVINSASGLHDMWGLTLDAFGNAYFATAQTQVGSAGYDNIIYKVPTPALSPITWQTPEGYLFIEVASVNYAPGPPNGFSGMTMSNVNLYTYDSYVLKRWNSGSGAMVSSASVNGASASTMMWGGLTADDCDHLFLGSNTSILQYDGNTMAQTGSIAAPGMVYDCELGKNNILYSCGQGFVMATQISLLPCSILQTTMTVTNPGCTGNGSATVTVTGGTSPYTITWNSAPPQTGPVLSNVPVGTYIATIVDNSCIKQTTYDTAVITSGGGGIPMTVNSGSICPGGSIALTATGATSYTWSPATGLSGINGPSVTANPSVTTVYTVTGTQTGCNGTATSTVTINPLPTVTANSGTICLGQQSSTLTATGASTYVWSPGTGLSGTTGTSVTANPGASTVYTITGTDANGCVNTGTTTVNVNALPNVTSSSSTICPTGTGTISASGATTYSWNTGATTISISDAPAATTVYTVTGTDANGCFSSGTGTITVNNTLSVSAGSNSPICAGSALTLTTTTGVSWSWTGPNGFSSSTQNPSISPATTAASGTYSLTATDAFGCFGSTTVPVTVNPLPVPTATTNAPICVNQNLTLSSSGGTSYSWSGPNTYTSSQQNPSINGVGMAANGVYTVTVTDANTCVNTTTISVTINPLPVVTATGATVCATGTISLTSNGGTVYSWNGPGPYSSNQQNPSIPNANVGMSGTYVVTVTDANNCSNSNTAQVLVNPLPVVTANNNTPICDGASLNLTCNTGVNWSWNGPGGFTSLQQNPTVAVATPGNNGTYSVTATDANGCSSTATTNVTVNPLPVPVASNNTPICAGASLNFTGSGGVNYAWVGPNSYTATVQNPTIGVSTAAMSGTYTLIVVDNNGCTATTITTVTVNTLPVVTVNSPTICLNNSTTLTAAGAATYSWSPATGLSATVGNNITASPTATSIYLVTGVDVNGCIGTANSTVLVNSLPPVAANTTAICLGQTTGTLTASGANTYAWSPVSGLSSSTGASVTANPGATTSYTVTGTDVNGCVNTATTSVTVNPIPILAASPQNSSGCAPICVNFQNTTAATGNCSWNFGDGSTSSTCTPSHCYTVQGAFNAVLTLTDANGCVGTTSATVNVYPVPDADFNASPQPTSILDPVIYFTDATTGATIAGWSWTFGDPNNSTSTSQNPVHVYTAVGSYDVILAVVSDQGCVDTTIKVIRIDDEFMIYVPNAFSPNGDGTNDIFTAKGEGVKTYKMYIFDRWGNLAFLTDDINKGWDGRFMGKGEEIVQEDVYVWKIELKNYKGEPRLLSGIVSLLK